MGHSFLNGFDAGLPWARLARAPILRGQEPMRSKNRSAPAVRFAFTRSRLQTYALCWIAVSGCLVCLFWSQVASTSPWRLWVAAVVVVGAAFAAVWGVKRTSQGSLFWDRHAWTFLPTKSAAGVEHSQIGTLRVHLDLQRFLLLSFHSVEGTKRWLWLDRGPDPRHWLAFRRAVFSPVSDRNLKRPDSQGLEISGVKQ